MSLCTILAAARRESRGARGRLFFFTACLALGSMAVVGVAGLVRSVQQGIAAQSQQLLGADVWLRSRSPLPEELVHALDEERARGARVLAVRLVQTMARAPREDGQGGPSRLVELKAVEAGFPFHGELVLEPAGRLDEFLAADTVVIAAELGAMLGVRVGDELALGSARFRVAALVLDEPGRLDPTFTAGPRVFATLDGFERMQLDGLGSRLTHGALVALPPGAPRAAQWAQELERRVPTAERVRIDSHEEAQPQVRRAAERVER
ncbi:MAG: hypothetical protein HOP15_09085, partial [Planctomycetes bacterium]|nr:hypothetical protein [Planctomycetota bacterium]